MGPARQTEGLTLRDCGGKIDGDGDGMWIFNGYNYQVFLKVDG